MEKMKLTCQLITALTLLCFIREDKVKISFEKLKAYFLNQTQDAGYKNFLEYFEKNWINNANIPISTWNFYNESVNEFGIFKRTNNCVESFHNMLSKRISRVSLH